MSSDDFTIDELNEIICIIEDLERHLMGASERAFLDEVVRKCEVQVLELEQP